MKGYLNNICNKFAVEFDDGVQVIVDALQLPYEKSEYLYSISNNELIRKKREIKSYDQIIVESFAAGYAKLKEYRQEPFVASIYHLECLDKNSSILMLYDVEGKRLVKPEPDPAMANIISRMQDSRVDLDDLRSTADNLFIVDYPFLAISAEPVIKSKDKGEVNSLHWTIVKFESNSFTNIFIPYFLHRSATEKDLGLYEFQILDTATNKPAFSSEKKNSQEDFDSYDIAVPVFDLNSRLVIANNAADVGFETCIIQKRSVISIGPRVLTLTHSPALDENQLSPYSLMARHKKGSIKNAADEQFQTNLLLSYSVFLVLILSSALMYYSIIKTRRASQQQLNFVNGISHELKTPLTTICTAGENLKDTIIKGDAEIEYYGDVIYKEGSKLHELVDQVLQYSGQLSGKYCLEMKTFPVMSIIETALNDNHILFEERGFDVSVNIPDKKFKVYGDQGRLASALKILISNALKYSGDSRRITIDVSRKTEGKKLETIISVTDFGIGIPEAEQNKIFTPFFRGAAVSESEIRGTGLGLSLADEIVQWHKGKLIFTSSPGKGSKFSIVLKHKVNLDEH